MQPSHPHPRVVYTFGDSILDCGHYNAYGLTPGGLLVTNQDALFPEFRGRDLSSRGPARLEHRARDGATLASLPAQARGLAPSSGEPAVALVTIGGNDLLQGSSRTLAGGSRPSCPPTGCGSQTQHILHLVARAPQE